MKLSEKIQRAIDHTYTVTRELKEEWLADALELENHPPRGNRGRGGAWTASHRATTSQAAQAPCWRTDPRTGSVVRPSAGPRARRRRAAAVSVVWTRRAAEQTAQKLITQRDAALAELEAERQAHEETRKRVAETEAGPPEPPSPRPACPRCGAPCYTVGQGNCTICSWTPGEREWLGLPPHPRPKNNP